MNIYQTWYMITTSVIVNVRHITTYMLCFPVTNGAICSGSAKCSVYFTSIQSHATGGGVILARRSYSSSAVAMKWCSFEKSPLGGTGWLTLTTGNEHCNTEGIEKMTSWFSALVGKSMCICVRYMCVPASKQAYTAECNISLMDACRVYDSSCMKKSLDLCAVKVNHIRFLSTT